MKWYNVVLLHNPKTGKVITNHIFEYEYQTKADAEKGWTQLGKAAETFKKKKGVDVSIYMFNKRDWAQMKKEYELQEWKRVK